MYPGSYFGEISFVILDNRAAGAEMLEAGVLHILKRTDFNSALIEFPKDFEKFCMMRD